MVSIIIIYVIINILDNIVKDGNKKIDIRKEAEQTLKHYSSNSVAVSNSNKKFNPNKIIDFASYYKHLTLADNDYLLVASWA